MIKGQISGRIVSSCISHVVTASVYSEKTCLNKLMMIMNKSQETTVFGGQQKDFRYETKARKVMVDFKFEIESILR